MKLTETKTVIKESINVFDKCGATISVVPVSDSNVKVVIGAYYADRTSCHFSKSSLLELIEELKAVADCMKGSQDV